MRPGSSAWLVTTTMSAPVLWAPSAAPSTYLKKNLQTGEVIETPRQAFWRVAAHVAKAELA